MPDQDPARCFLRKCRNFARALPVFPACLQKNLKKSFAERFFSFDFCFPACYHYVKQNANPNHLKGDLFL